MEPTEKIPATPMTLERADLLLQELARRLNVITPDALEHLVRQKVLDVSAAGGCCKPDGGTCCPNARLSTLPGRQALPGER